MLLDEDPKPCKSNPMRNKPDFIKNIFGLNECWKDLCEEDITKHILDTHELSIIYL
jgi:hypothetical protein